MVRGVVVVEIRTATVTATGRVSGLVVVAAAKKNMAEVDPNASPEDKVKAAMQALQLVTGVLQSRGGDDEVMRQLQAAKARAAADAASAQEARAMAKAGDAAARKVSRETTPLIAALSNAASSNFSPAACFAVASFAAAVAGTSAASPGARLRRRRPLPGGGGFSMVKVEVDRRKLTPTIKPFSAPVDPAEAKLQASIAKQRGAATELEGKIEATKAQFKKLEDDALVVYTLSDAGLATAVATACKAVSYTHLTLPTILLV